MLRTVRRIALVLAALVVVCLATLVVLARVYDAEVKAKLIGTLNGYLTAPVTVSSMDLTLIERFPRASIHLHDVLAHDATAASDTLLYAEDLYLEFSLMGMLRGTYKVDQVHGVHVIAHPAVNSLGRGNWMIWKADSTSGGSDFSLDRVSLDDLLVRYRDPRSGLDVLASSDRLAFTGRFRKAGSELKLKGDAALREWRDDGRMVLSDRRMELDAHLAFGGPDGSFHITRGEVLSEGVPLALTLDFVPGVKSDQLDLRANGMELQLADAVKLLPDFLRKRLEGYGVDGEVDLALTYKGPMDPGPEFSIGMKVRNGSMKERRSGAQFKAINAECAIDLNARGDLSRLLVKGFSARAANGTISGSWDMKGVKNAPIKASIKADIALAELLRFAQVDTLEQAEGRLIANARVEGKLRNVADLKAADLRALKISGTAQLKDATLKLKGIRHVVSDLHAELVLDGNDAEVRSLSCSLQGSTLELKGRLDNLMPYLLFDGQPVMIAAEGSSPRIDLAALLREDRSTTGGRDYVLTLPALVQVDLKARVDELVFEEFHATGITGTISIKDRVLRASPMMFNTASGGVLGTLSLDTRGEGDHALAIDASVKDMDVKKLFAEFQEFGQQFITSRHLNGTADAQVVFTSPLSPSMKLDLDRLRCTVDIAITDGGIRQHQPLMDVATYVAQNKMIAPFVDVEELRRRLADVTFTQLENRIEIRDRKVIVPAMVVHNSVMDIELSGSHGFDDQIDHHLHFRLSDLLKKNDADDEFGPVVDDGTGLRIFLHMYGPATAPQFETDGAMAAERRREGIREQTAELRSILHNELNPFRKKDDTIPPATSTNDARITVEWSEGDSAGPAAQPKPKKKGFGALFEEKPEEKEVIELEP